MSKLRIGIIGAGNIARTHLNAYKAATDAEVAAICDIDFDRAKKAADDFGIKSVYGSMEEMIESVQLDAIDVCVWNVNHCVCSVYALNHGLHVLCEKPMAYSSEQARQMIEAAKKNNKLLMIGFVLRFSDNARIAMDFINNGYLGDIYHTKATYLRRHGAPGGWFCDKSKSGGGPVIDLGVHVIDLTRFMMGSPRPVSVYAVTQNKLGNRPYLKNDVNWKPEDAREDDLFDVEDFGTAIIRYDNGSTTLLETSYSLNGEERTSQDVFGTKGGMNICGDVFKIYTEVNGYLADVSPKTSCLKQGSDMFEAEIKHFVDCALNGTKCIASAEDGETVMKILDAIYESAASGHEILIK